MNFFKWFLYLTAFGSFIWFIYFRPIGLDTEVSTTPDVVTSDIGQNYDEGNQVDNSSDETDGQYVPDRTISDDKVDEIAETTVEETPITSGSINTTSKYLIVVGSFGVKSNAERMLKRVKASGKDGVITKIRGLHRVVTASTDDQTDAEQLKSHFTHIYKEVAFILEP
jgi:hypothetical protein